MSSEKQPSKMVNAQKKLEETFSSREQLASIEGWVMKGGEQSNDIVQFFTLLNNESKVKLEDLGGYTATHSHTAPHEKTQHAKLAPAYQVMKAALLSPEQQIEELKQGSFRSSAATNSTQAAKNLEIYKRQQLFFLQAINVTKSKAARSEGVAAAADWKSELTAILASSQCDENAVQRLAATLLNIQSGEATVQNAALINETMRGNHAENAIMAVTKALVQAYLSQQNILKLAKEEEGKQDVEATKDRVAALETVMAAVMDSLAVKLDQVCKQHLQSPEQLGTMMTSENSIARSCQLLCLLCCTEDAFDQNLDRIAHSIKKYAMVLNLAETKLEGNIDLRNIQDQVIYTIGVVAYRLIKEQQVTADDRESAFVVEACKAGHTVDPKLFQTEVSSRTLELITNAEKIIEESDGQQSSTSQRRVPGKLMLSQEFTDSNYMSANSEKIDPVVAGLISSEEGPQDIIGAVQALHQAYQAKDNLYKMQTQQQSKMNACLPIMRAIFVMMLKQNGRLPDFKQFVQSPNSSDQRKQDLVNIWGQAGQLTLKHYQTFNNKGPSGPPLLEKNSKLLASLSANEQSFWQKAVKMVDSAHDLKPYLEDRPVCHGVNRAVGFHLLSFGLQFKFSHERFFSLIRWFQGAMRATKKAQVHCLTSLPTLSDFISDCIRQQFAEIITLIKEVFKAQDWDQDSSKREMLVHLLSALCWNYTQEDFNWLKNQEIFATFREVELLRENIRPLCQQTANRIACEILSAAAHKCATKFTESMSGLPQFSSSYSQVEPSRENDGLLDQIIEYSFGSICDYLPSDGVTPHEQENSTSEVNLSFAPKASVTQQLKKQATYNRRMSKVGTQLQELQQIQICKQCGYQNSRRRVCKFFHAPLTEFKESFIPNREAVIAEAARNVVFLASLSQSLQTSDTQNKLLESAQLREIIRLSVESSPFNQILAHKILQTMVQFSAMNEDTLEIALAEIQIKPVSSYPSQDQIVFQGSPFMQFLFDQIMLRSSRMDAANAELRRTVKEILLQSEAKFAKQINALKNTLRDSLGRIGNLSSQQISALFGLVPEMGLQKIAIGSHCFDSTDTKKRFVVLGHYQDSNTKTTLFPSAVGTDLTQVKGLSCDSKGINFVFKNLAKIKPVLDKSPDKCKQLTQGSLVFSDANLLKAMLAVDFQTNLSFANFFLRGLSNTLSILARDYVRFLADDEDLFQKLIQKIKPFTQMQAADLNLIEHLEQRADILEEMGVTASQQPIQAQASNQAAGPTSATVRSFSSLMQQGLTDTKLEQIKSFLEQPADAKDIKFGLFQHISRGEETLEGAALTLKKSLFELLQHRSRKILLLIQSEEPMSCQEDLAAQNFQLLHDEHSIAAKAGFQENLKKVQRQIRKIMVHIQATNKDQTEAFVQNLFERGQKTVEAGFSSELTKKVGSRLLNPQNLLYFGKIILEMYIIDRAELGQQSRRLYDLMVTFALGFCGAEDIQVSQKLLMSAKAILMTPANQAITSVQTAEEADDLFSNQILHSIFFKTNESQRLLLNSNGMVIFEIIEILRKGFEDFKKLRPELGREMRLIVDKRCKKVQDMWGQIKSGMLPESSIWNPVKIMLALQDEQARHKAKEWGQLYASDPKVFDDIQFKTIVKATDEEKTIFIDKNGSDQTVVVTSGNEALLANSTRLNVFTNNRFVVRQGTEATIEVRKSTPVVQCSGQLDFSVKNQMQSADWQNLFDSSVLPKPVQVVANGESVMFVCEDDSLYGFGKHFAKTPSKGWLCKIPKPDECRDYLKVLYCKEFRIILTNSSKIFVHGKNFEDIFTLLNENANAEQSFQEVQLQNLFPPNTEVEKIVDVSMGSENNKNQTNIKHEQPIFEHIKYLNIFAMVTESGKVYARSRQLWKAIGSSYRKGNKPDEAFEINADKQCSKATSVKCMTKSNAIFINVEKEDGSGKNTFAVGNVNAHIPAKRGKVPQQMNRILPIFWPRDWYKTNQEVQMKKIINNQEGYLALDSKNNLWCWGSFSSLMGNEDNEEDKEAIFDIHANDDGKRILSRFKWFEEKGLTVKDIEQSKYAFIIKLEDANGAPCMYGIPYRFTTFEDADEEDAARFGVHEHLACISVGSESFSEVDGDNYKDKILKLGITNAQSDKPVLDCSKILSFACTKKCSFLILKQPDQAGGAVEEESKEGEESKQAQENSGVIHFYKDANGWKTVRQNQFEASKANLPNICFASRYEIPAEKLSELEEYMRGVNDAQIDSQAQNHGRKTSNDQIDIPKSRPMYYSNYKGAQVVATQEEVFAGGQTWDLNPLIFYRVSQPISGNSLEQLQQIKLNNIFEQNEKRDRQIMISVRQNEVPIEKINEAIQCATDQTRMKIQELHAFTPKEDTQILEVIEKQLKFRFPDAGTLKLYHRGDEENNSEDEEAMNAQAAQQETVNSFAEDLKCKFVLNVGQFNLDASEFEKESTMQAKGTDLIQMRAQLLIQLNMVFYRLFNFVNHEYRLQMQTNHGKHYAQKSKILPTLIQKLVKDQLIKVKMYFCPANKDEEAKVSIKKALLEDVENEEVKSADLSDQEENTSIFHQLVRQLRQCLTPPDGVDDPLNLYIFRNHVSDYQPFKVGFVDSGKVIDAGGAYRSVMSDVIDELQDEDKVKCLKKSPDSPQGLQTFLLNEKSDEDDDLFICLGGLLAFSFLTGQPFGVEMAPVVWKQIVSDKIDIEDLKNIDRNTYIRLRDQYPMNEDNPDEENVELDRAVKTYFSKFDPQIKLIRKGMNTVLDGRLDVISYLPVKEIQERICGRPDYEIKDLKSITKYQGEGFSDDSEEEDEEYAGEKEEIEKQRRWFWDTLCEFDKEQRRDYLMFVWGRTRLPKNLQGVEKHAYMLFKEKQQDVLGPDKRKSGTITKFRRNGIPSSHTCNFQFESPYYDSQAELKRQLLYAIQNARGIED